MLKLENFQNYLENYELDGNGEIVICLPSKDETKSKVKSQIENITRNQNFPLAVALPTVF